MADKLDTSQAKNICFLIMFVLTIITYLVPEVVPIHMNVAVFSLAIIVIGSLSSVETLV